jgi:hypothetical protein
MTVLDAAAERQHLRRMLGRADTVLSSSPRWWWLTASARLPSAAASAAVRARPDRPDRSHHRGDHRASPGDPLRCWHHFRMAADSRQPCSQNRKPRNAQQPECLPC